MSTIDFIIDDWISDADPDPRYSSTCAEFVINVNDIKVTRQYDAWSRTVTDRARLPLYPMAEWFAYNWWRHRYEAAFEGGETAPLSWLVSHDTAAIGHGIIWPRLRFASDDFSMNISARALRNAPWEPVRYLNEITSEAVERFHFDLAVESLISSVLSRLDALGVSAEPLRAIWSDVLAERSDDEISDWRRWEARLGYDPDQAPESVMNEIDGLAVRAGRGAAWEIAPIIGNSATYTLERISAIHDSAGLEARLPKAADEIARGKPWEVGRKLAFNARRGINKISGPLCDQDLLEMLGAPREAFSMVTAIPGPISLGVRESEGGISKLLFRRRNRPGQRFEAARFLAEALTSVDDDIWLPLTDRGTARQKMQRAFAAELLIPIDDLRNEFGNNFTEEKCEHLSEDYGVSELAIKSHLANHGVISADEVVVFDR